MTKLEFNLHTARNHAESGKVDIWIDAYLRAGEWVNLGLADGLHLAPRWWIGPVSVPLTMIQRVCGPEEDMEYPQPLDGWNERVGKIVDSFTSVEDMPPFIVQHHGDELFTVRDGNHRHEALKRLGLSQAWVFIWCDSEQDHKSAEFLVLSA